MSKIRKLLALGLILVFFLSGCTPAPVEEKPVSYTLGGNMGDFTVTTWDGKTVNLFDVLKEKEMVLINIWATWCGPCCAEFPFLEEAYEQYSDRVEVIALSSEETDTNDVLTDFVAEMGLTFPVAQDTPDLSTLFNVDGIPTSIVVDRYGVICFLEAGSQTDASSFMRLFDVFLGEDYTESVILSEIPPMLPNVEASDEAQLNAALNAEGGDIVFKNGADQYDWPMTVCEKDGRTVVASSNAGVNSSSAVVNAALTAKAGDAVVVTFRTSSEAASDLLTISVDGTPVKRFGGEKDWMTYAWSVENDGEYALTLSYVKDYALEDGEDCVWIDSVAVVSGDAVAAALAVNPVYPVADELTLGIANESAKQIIIDDPDEILPGFFGPSLYYIVPDDTVTVSAFLTADIDPEAVYAYCNYDGASYPAIYSVFEGGYIFESGIDSLETSGYSSTSMYLVDSASEDYPLSVTYFASEENVNAFIAEVNATIAEGYEGVPTLPGTWAYSDGTLPSTYELPGDSVDPGGMSAYTLIFVDQNGDPVPGVVAQICDDETCMTATSDELGRCELTMVPYAYEIHILKVPEGYTGDTETVTVASADGGELTFVLTKE